ncbi:MAG: PDZ domain-containing protein [Dehalococcoidia bacterium]|nr:PDZ domain-containing protein [Dehalococcoidia bacterium]
MLGSALNGLSWSPSRTMRLESMSWRQASLLTLAFAVVGLAAGALGGLLAARALDEDDSDEPQPVVEDIAPPTVAEVVEQASRAVVTIIGQSSRVEGEAVVETVNVGSGVILRDDGFIVTNEHVIAGADRLTVVLASGDELAATVIGDDRPFNDLAVIKVAHASPLTAVAVGDSDQIEPGQSVIALGQSLRNLPLSVSTGVVSGVHRQFFKDNVFMEDLVQTDAAINQGNSGGALLNGRGELIGILTTVVRDTGNGDSVEGIAFAISSRTVADVAFQLIASGSVRRPWIGVETQEVTIQQADGVPRQATVVMAVDPNGPAVAAGLLVGDLILSIEGDEVSEESPFLNLLKELRAGDSATLGVARNAEALSIEVDVVERSP